ncbi:MAG: ATP-dependent DNA helicase RecG [Clostridia bacterium]|nr:ATP-dependent DNA helicase RecG [Clostridia bacterium]
MPKTTKSGGVNLASPVTVLSGVGPAKAAAYAKAGIETLEDLLLHIPRAYENRGDIRLLSDSRADGGKSAVVLTVATTPQAAKLKGRLTIVKFRAFDESGSAEIVFFNMPYLRQVFTVGSEWRFFGVVERTPIRGGMKYKISSPAYEPYTEGALPDFTAVYPLSEGLTQKNLAAHVAEALRLCGSPEDVLPDEIRRRRELCTLPFAVRNIHNPESYVALAAAKKRLIYDEFFLFSLSMSMQGKKKRDGHAFSCKKQNISPLLSELPYELTGAQKRAITEIATDMKSETPMRRMLIGDVGCGKTIVAAAAMLIAVLSGRQAALMAPTEILARQHYEDLSELFGKLGIKCELLIGATSAKDKRRIYSTLSAEDPEVRTPIVIGTHALLSEGVQFSALSLVVTDEQHRFGVNQRAALTEKSKGTHLLSMSATPIPRSLALVMYGDIDISRINEMPPGRQRVDTFVVDENYRSRLIAFIKKTASEGGQIYVVCPSIEENPDRDPGEVDLYDIGDSGINRRPPLKAAIKYADELSAALPELSVAFLHGKLKSEQKEAIMTSFECGDIDVLVSTTVIEVGVNVPNASLMIVENAERFGLSQLHQLRGRVGRGKRKSYCILVSDDGSDTARKRLTVMRDNYDGFSIAEADLAARGPGDFLASNSNEIRQSGGLRFKFADLCGDASLLTSATEDAHSLLAASPTLGEYPALRESLSRLGAATNTD